MKKDTFYAPVALRLVAALLALTTALHAQTARTWNGGGGTGTWSTATNWGGTAPVAGNSLIFAGTTQTSTTNDLAADTSFAGISFTNTTANQAFTLGGNRIVLGGNISTTGLAGGVGTATILDTINMDLVLSGTRNITTTASSTNGNHNLAINGVISETGGSFGISKQGGSGGILTLSAANTFTGTVTLISGTLSFNTIADSGTPSALGAGGIILTASSAGSTGTLSYTGTGSSTNRQIQIGTGTTFTSTVGTIIENVGSGVLVFSNANFNVPAASFTAAKTLTIQGSNVGNNQISGIIMDNSATGTIGITKDGSGTWILAGLNTYSGQTRIDTGTLSVNSLANAGTASAIGTGALNSLINIGSSTTSGTLIHTGSTDSSTNRQVQIGRSTTGTGGTLIQSSGTGTVTFSNAVFNVSDLTVTSTAAARTLTLQGTNTGSNLISGIISNNVGSGSVVAPVAVTKTNSGTWILAGLNTFSGQVRIDNGTLSVNSVATAGNASALGTGGTNPLINIGSGTSTGTLVYTGASNASTDRQVQIGRSVSSSGGAIIQNDGSGTLTFANANFNTSDLTITSAGTRTLTLQGSNTGSNEISGIISNNVGSSSFVGVLSLVKAGTGTWRLSGVNAYTGTTTISGGVLDVGGMSSGALASGGLLFSNSAVLQGNGTFNRTFSGASTAAAGELSGVTGGFAARGGTLTVNFGGAGASVSLSSGSFRFGDNFVFGSASADSPVIVVNPLSTNGTFVRTFTVNSGLGGDYAELQGAITSTGSIVKAGPGLLVLSGDNTVSGSLTVNAGTLQFGNSSTNAGTTGAAPFSAIINNGSLVFNRSNAFSYTGVISGGGSLTQQGAGTTALSGTNTYNGATIISAGTLQLGSGGTAGSIDSTNGITNNATLAFNRSNTLNVLANITGSGVVNQIGTGITNLSGSNSYNGGTNVTAGTLTFLNTTAKPASGITTVAAGATLGLGVATSGSLFTSLDVDNLFAGTLSNVSNDVASNVGIDTSAGDFTYASSVPAITRGLTKLGSNTLTLTGANGYTGTTTINGGVLDIGTISNGSLGSGGLVFANNSVLQGNGTFTRSFSGSATAAAGQLTGPSGGFAAKGGTLTVNFGGVGASVTISNSNVRFGSNFVFGSPTADSKVVVVNPLVLNQITRTFTVNSGVGVGGDSAELQGVISSTDVTDGIIKAGPGLLTLTATSTYTGATTINAGTLQLGSGGTSGSINSTSSITNNATLAFNRSNTLAVTAAISGNGVVNQIGSGITNLSGNNIYAGGTNVNAGTLTYLNTNAKPASGTTTVAAGATLGLGVAAAGSFFTATDVDNLFAGTMSNVSNDPGSRVGIDTTAGDFSYGSSIPSTTRGLTKLGDNTLSLTGTNAYTGATTVVDGILRLDSAGALPGGIASTGGTSNLVLAGGVVGLTASSGDFARGVGSGPGQVRWITDTVSGFAAFGGDRTVNFGGSVTPSTVSWSNTGGILGNGLILSDATSDSTITIANPIALNFANSSRTVTVIDGTAAVDAVFAGALSSLTTSGSGTRLIKNGAGTLALIAANTYVSGSSNPGTTISAGTLQLGNGGTTGSISALTGTNITSDVSISSGATFAFNRSDAGLVVANTIVGAGMVSQRGTGTTTLSGANTYSGGTSVIAGTLLVTNATGSATGAGPLTTASGTTLGGTGTIAPTGTIALSLGGVVSPGIPGTTDGVGTLTFTPVDGNVKFESTSSVLLQLRSNGTNGLILTYNPDGTISTVAGTPSLTGNDRIFFNSSGTGLLDFSSALAGSLGLAFVGGYTPQLFDAFDLLDWNGLAISGLSESQLNLPSLGNPSLAWDTSKFASHGVVAITQIVPEPSRALLLCLGLGCLGMVRRRI